MSGGGWKHPFEQVAAEDSRGFAQLGRTLGWQGLVDEAKHNEQNPGRAITKAGINAALWYLGGEAAGAAGSGAGAGTAAATDAAESGGTLALNSAANGVSAYGQAASQIGPGLLAGGTPDTAETVGLLQMPQGAGNAMEAGMTDTGYTPSSLFQAAKNANAANGTPLSQNIANYYKDAATNAQNGGMMNQFVSGAKGPAGRKLAMNTALKMMQPPQQQPMPMGRPAPQGQPAPLTNPYQGGNPYGPGGNSLGLTEEQKQRLRMMGVNI